jgi:hypothetical protein
MMQIAASSVEPTYQLRAQPGLVSGCRRNATPRPIAA